MARPFASLLLAVCTCAAALACGPTTRTNSESCIARAQIQSGLNALDRIDFSDLNQAQVQSALATLRNGVTRAEAGVNLPQNVDLRKLGGLPYLQTVDSHLIGLMAEVSRDDPSSIDMARVHADVAAQTREGQRIVDSIKGC